MRHRHPPQHAGRLGWHRRVPPRPRGRPARRAPEGVDQALHGRPRPRCSIRAGQTKTGYLWALARDDRGWGGADPPGVVFFYAPNRAGENAEKILRGFDG
ncbi:MAG: transposase [Paracoccaceae bacterium]